MIRSRWQQTRIAAAAIASALGLAACSVSSPLAITSVGDGLERGASLALVDPEDKGQLDARFRAAVKDALSSQSVQIADQSTLIAEVSASQSDASNGVLSGDGAQATDEDSQDWIARPRRDKPLDRCKAKRLRATVTIYSSAADGLAYRGSGEAIDCSFDDEDLRRFAQALVNDALDPANR
ncbi:MAG: hypothetical protein AAFZ11_09990 [Pseudomonadota bacterium]